MASPAYVLEPTSILVNRRARRAKTDRLDAEGMLRVLMAWLAGDRQVCSMVRVPTPEEEDAKRPHREREHLVQERLRIENRIEALLFTQGIRGGRRCARGSATWPSCAPVTGVRCRRMLRAELDRLRRRLVLALELIREVEAERAAALAAIRTTTRWPARSRPSSRIRGIGENFAAVLGARGALPHLRQPPSARQLRRHRADALPERRHGPGPRHQPGRQPAGSHDAHPACLAVAALPARQRARRVVSRARRHLGRAHAADRHRRDGAASC